MLTLAANRQHAPVTLHQRIPVDHFHRTLITCSCIIFRVGSIVLLFVLLFFSTNHVRRCKRRRSPQNEWDSHAPIPSYLFIQGNSYIDLHRSRLSLLGDLTYYELDFDQLFQCTAIRSPPKTRRGTPERYESS